MPAGVYPPSVGNAAVSIGSLGRCSTLSRVYFGLIFEFF